MRTARNARMQQLKCVLRRLLAHREFISGTESSQRVLKLKLLGHVRATLRVNRASGGRKRPISATCRKTSWSDIGGRVPIAM